MTKKERVFLLQSDSDFQAVRHHIHEYLVRHLVPFDTMVEVAINEAVNNAYFHGVGGSVRRNRTVRIRLAVYKRNRLLVRVKDDGEGFSGNDILQKIRDGGKISSLVEPLRECGRGILIIHHVADFVCYNRRGNEILFVKRLSQG